jgi:hypothetical protein
MDLCVADVDKNDDDDSNGFFYIVYMRLPICVSEHKVYIIQCNLLNIRIHL